MDKLEPTSGATMNITPEQLMAVAMLRNHPAIDFTSFHSHSRGNTMNIGVVSKVNASQGEIDDALAVIFPTMLYDGNPYNCGEEKGVSTIIYGMKVKEQDVRISLYMKMTFEKEEAPADTGATQEIIFQPQCTTDDHELEGFAVQTIDDLGVVYEGVNANA